MVVRGVAVIIVNDELVMVVDVIVVVGWVIYVSVFTSTTIIAIVFVIDPNHCWIMRTTPNCPYCCYYRC